MQNSNWKCQKCDGVEFEEDYIMTTGKGFSRFFNVQNRRFLTVTCSNCRLTDLYKSESNKWMNVMDFLGN